MSARGELSKRYEEDLVFQSLAFIIIQSDPWASEQLRAADAILAAGWRPPARVVTTAEELDALPTGTVVRSTAGTIACRFDSTRCVVFGDDRAYRWVDLKLPVTVLYEGGAR